MQSCEAWESTDKRICPSPTIISYPPSPHHSLQAEGDRVYAARQQPGNCVTTQRGSRAEEVGDNKQNHTYREGEDAAARCLRLRWCPQAILTTRLLLHVLEGVSRATDVDAKILTTEKESRSPAWIGPPAPAA